MDFNIIPCPKCGRPMKLKYAGVLVCPYCNFMFSSMLEQEQYLEYLEYKKNRRVDHESNEDK